MVLAPIRSVPMCDIPIVRPALDPTRAIQQRQGLRQQRAAVVVELQAFADAVEQLQLEQALQLVDGGTRGGLRERDGRGGPAVLPLSATTRKICSCRRVSRKVFMRVTAINLLDRLIVQ